MRPAEAPAKEQVKRLLRASPAAYKAAEVLYENSLFAHHIVTRGLGGTVLRGPRRTSATPARQDVITWGVPLPAWRGHVELIDCLRARGIRVTEGGHTVYVPPQDALRRLIAPIVDFYPPGSGFKILKDCRAPERARYLHKHRRTLPLLSRMIGTPLDQLVPANHLYSAGMGPRVWDVAAWASGDSRCTVFVVAHVSGRAATAGECGAFLSHLRDAERTTPLRVLIPDWERNEDFRTPDCNGNLVYSVALDRPQYVDFQNFGLTRRGDDNRRFSARWTRLGSLLRECRLDLQGRVVIDPACGDGAGLAASLSHGAAWAVGWCSGTDADAVEASLLGAGFTRFTIVRNDEEVDVASGVPAHLHDRLSRSVALWESDGTLRLDQLMRLPCETLVCEGRHSASIWTIRNFSGAGAAPDTSTTHTARRLRIVHGARPR